jgi:hypothetical protein
MAFEWYQTNPAQIVQHSVHLRGIGGDVREALTAVEGVRVPGDGYGESGGLFAKTLGDIADEGTHTLIAAIVAMESAASALKKSAEDYQRTEDANRDQLRGAGQRR